MKNNQKAPCENSKDFYCDFVLNNKITVKKLYEDELVLAYYHTKPNWLVHVVVLPKAHVPSLIECDETTLSALFVVIKRLAEEILMQHGSCRVLTNLGTYQDSKHLHWHLYVE